MDPITNKLTQTAVANEILAIWDDCNADGTLTTGQMEAMCDLANRLAQLVEALAGYEEWKKLKRPLVR